MLDELVRQLFAKETLNRHEVAEIFIPLRRRDKREAWTGSDLRVPSEEPPIEIPPGPVEPVVQVPTPTPDSVTPGNDPTEPPTSGPDTWEPPTAGPGPGTWDPPAWGPPTGPRA